MSEPSAERIRLLSLVDIFEPLSGEEIERLDGRLPDRHVESGEIFYGPQDLSERLFILQKGKARIFRTAPDGREFTLAVVESGTVFGEMALAGLQPEGAYAQAVEPSMVSTILKEDLEQLVLEKPEVGLQIMRVLSERLRRQESRLEDATMKDVHARLAGIILLLVESEGVRSGTGYKIPVHYTHERLGTMIGANRVAVTRAFGLLQDKGVVELRRRLIHVTDIEALKRSAAYGDAQEAR
ncbi:Crp/Fnr family transcriptional regulator [Rubrobacter tropicus]|uniref:Crp/Fnr family transcriptional regulator n=1 Tax=Rubrobacter tropicus TaxID=2653851 RepID=UPI00140A061E|nr:Crp/Fnr family transcriptional regulator [Rubrobacter tropicus]